MNGPLICRRTATVAELEAGGEWCACDRERGVCHFEMAKRRHKLGLGECLYCDIERDLANDHHPPHDASPRCESGRHPHCTCDVCF